MKSLVQKYNVPGPRYTSYPTVPYWDATTIDGQSWRDSVVKSFNESNLEEGISLYIHLPFCEALCTFCGCHKRITKRHSVESPYIKAVLKEWDTYVQLLGSTPRIKEIHLGGGTPTFFSPENLDALISGILAKAETTEHYEFSFEAHPNNTSSETENTINEEASSPAFSDSEETSPNDLKLVSNHFHLDIHSFP